MANKIACQFKKSCENWQRKNHNWVGRQEAYLALINKYGAKSVMRHQDTIKAALDNIERTNDG